MLSTYLNFDKFLSISNDSQYKMDIINQREQKQRFKLQLDGCNKSFENANKISSWLYWIRHSFGVVLARSHEGDALLWFLLLVNVLFYLPAQIFPVVNHQLLNCQQCLVSDVGVWMAKETHHQCLASQLFQHTKRVKTKRVR